VKSIALILSYLSSPVPRRNLRVVLGLLATLVVLVALFSVVFTCPVRDGSAQVEPRPTRPRPCLRTRRSGWSATPPPRSASTPAPRSRRRGAPSRAHLSAGRV
jgi:hypothetical protein